MRNKIAFTARLLALMLAFCAVGRVWAATEVVDGITWEYTVNNGKASVSDEWGDSGSAIPSSTAGAITIPSTLGGYKVTSIGSYAFIYCSGLTSVTIPDGVTSIGDYAFYGCSGLTSVTIPNSVTNIGSYAFIYCSGLTSVTIPDSVTSIGHMAFAYCSGLASVTIPDSVTSIGGLAFRDCNNLYDTTTILGVKLVDGWAVGYTDSIPADLDLSGARGIARSAFEDCSGLKSVTIPDSVTSIGERAFSLCSGLKSVTIPDSVTSIGDQAFRYCSGLTSVMFNGNAPSYVGEEAFSGVAAGCGAVVSRNSTGWRAGEGELWNGLVLRYWPEVLTSVAEGDDVAARYVIETFADERLVENVTNATEYAAFSEWASAKNIYQPDLQTSQHAYESFVLGAERLLDNEPTVEFSDVDVGGDSSDESEKGTITLSVTVKDGEDAVAVASEKVKDMFEATSSLGDWDGEAKLTPNVEVLNGEGNTMRFKVTPGDGKSPSAFLRIKR